MPSSTVVRHAQNMGQNPFDVADQYHPTETSKYIYYEKYSRWSNELGRRETWPETVKRAVDFLWELADGRLEEDLYDEIYHAVLRMDVLPSMRLMAMAGDAARRSHITLYNCAYLTVDNLDAFAEALVISMSGTGVGYSVEQKYTNQLPVVIPQKEFPRVQFVVQDSAEGWVDALRTGLNCWFNGFDIEFHYELVRPAGAILKTKGGRASGPQPLRAMLDFTRGRILDRQGGKLSSLDCHDIMGNIAMGAVSGGHRRSAMIALYSWNDQEMRHCKDGEFWNHAPWRTTANNSAVLDGTSYDVTDSDLRLHFQAMAEGGNGEPGIFSRDAASNLRPERRANAVFGTNPCAEISLRPWQFCNLTEVVLKPNDTFESIIRKTRLATLIGTIQASATYFPGLRSAWARNCEAERLLGVGFTGQMDCPTFQNPDIMQWCKAIAVEWNRHYAQHLGINSAASTTCVKPSGSTALLTDASSGLHTRWSKYYIRRFRTLANGPISQVLQESGFDLQPENGYTMEDTPLHVVSFPCKAPLGAVTRDQRSALQQCEYWKTVKLNLTEHNPSVTITFKPDEVKAVEDWVVANRGILGGMAFLPHFDEHIGLQQMPYESITQRKYQKLVDKTPKMNVKLLNDIEKTDHTTAAQEVACSAGLCEL
jgi:ribonucleoside-triphosphate reductase (thioredoxin)